MKHGARVLCCFQGCKLCEVREHTGWEGRDRVGKHGMEWMLGAGKCAAGMEEICQRRETSESAGSEGGDVVGIDAD